jgi:predicted glycoside hydrolase/deacetylase ChbG (UPF0249 family)
MGRLIVTADDCGLSEGINLATLDLFHKGIVTDASLMTNFAAAQHAISLFGAYPGLKLGVHLNLTDGMALQDRNSSSLTLPGGRFRSKLNLIARSLAARPAFLALAESELAAQIEVFEKAGLQPNHLSTHIQFHLFPALRNMVFRLAVRYRVAWVRPNRLQDSVIPLNPFWRRQPHLSRRDTLEQTQRPDYLVVLRYWIDHEPEELAQIIKGLPGTVELVVHPCLAEDDSFPDHLRYPPRERSKEMPFLERLWLMMH